MVVISRPILSKKFVERAGVINDHISSTPGREQWSAQKLFFTLIYNPWGISSHQHCCASEGLCVSLSDAGQGDCTKMGGLLSWSLERGKETPRTQSAWQQHTTATIGHANLISPGSTCSLQAHQLLDLLNQDSYTFLASVPAKWHPPSCECLEL